MGGRLLRPGEEHGGHDDDLAVRRAPGGVVGAARHSHRNQSNGSGGSARRIVYGRSLVAGLSPATGVDYAAVVSYLTDPRVDEYIDALPGWQQAICREVRDLVHGADREVTETIKRTDRPYFVLQGNICALLAAKDHVNIFLYEGGIVPDPEGIITAGHENKTARTVAIREGEAMNAPALTAMFKQVVANNRTGGWRRVKAGG